MRALALALLVLGGCADETVSGYTDSDAVWRLIEMDGAPVTAEATLRFPAEGQVSGTGPCNGFTARQEVPYPWIAIEAIASTRRACPDLAAESAYFSALGKVSQAEVLGDVLILRGADGEEMVFRRDGG